MSEDPATLPLQLLDRLDALSALLQDLIKALSNAASAQQALRRHAGLIADLRQAAEDAQTATLH